MLRCVDDTNGRRTFIFVCRPHENASQAVCVTNTVPTKCTPFKGIDIVHAHAIRDGEGVFDCHALTRATVLAIKPNPYVGFSLFYAPSRSISLSFGYIDVMFA